MKERVLHMIKDENLLNVSDEIFLQKKQLHLMVLDPALMIIILVKTIYLKCHLP